MSASRLIPILLTASVLIIGTVARTESGPDTERVEAYHAKIAAKLEAMPYRWEGWVGQDIETPPAAQRLLRPNALFSRSYRHSETGDQCHVLVVHCRDTRDMVGHYPPVCYPAHGWADRSAQLDGGAPGRVVRNYRFERLTRNRTEAIVVRNFFSVPEEGRLPDMESVRSIDEYRGRRVLGAAQVQMVFGGGMSESERREAAASFERMLEPALEAIQDWSTR